MSRKVARELAFKGVFSYDFQNDNENLNSIIEDLEKDVTDLNDEDKKYINDIIVGVSEKCTQLDETITKYLKGWTMERISKTDLAILRVAIFEILFREDIPYKVSVNEAIELAKMFSDDNSPSFVNGVLAGVVSNL